MRGGGRTRENTVFLSLSLSLFVFLSLSRRNVTVSGWATGVDSGGGHSDIPLHGPRWFTQGGGGHSDRSSLFLTLSLSLSVSFLSLAM